MKPSNRSCGFGRWAAATLCIIMQLDLLVSAAYNIDTIDNIEETARSIAADLRSHYHDDEYGQVPGILPGPPAENKSRYYANGCFFNTGIRLARYTNNDTYAKYTEETWDWIWEVKYIDHESWLVLMAGMEFPTVQSLRQPRILTMPPSFCRRGVYVQLSEEYVAFTGPRAIDPAVDNTSGAGEATNALAAVPSLLIDGTNPSVTSATGGISKRNDGSGHASNGEEKLAEITTDDRAGAWILTVMCFGLFIAGFVWVSMAD
ncbi:Glycosyl hydrolase family 76 [Metarhizium acridum CQMa 102]|uniref:mannan endo-1,6-alpha-mannosidase n=1 Tax=Metarhizium acridum (strain CQMa 102) TaxID=655827 RepID=E9DRD1_METAQ|nr:Glycosyl hydrolase family 76 [Metarhizium acridum CQMa 102]EFY93809.1 Glycosyl hydrolase family 76 [Metarhizium acridum CQMa 102]